MSKDIEHVFVSPTRWVLCLALYPLLNWVIYFLDVQFSSYLHILDTNSQSDIYLVKIFPILLPVTLNNGFLYCAQPYNLMICPIY